MKIATLSIPTFFAAILIGVVLAIAFSPVPSAVQAPPVIVTPVPTPDPVYFDPIDKEDAERIDAFVNPGFPPDPRILFAFLAPMLCLVIWVLWEAIKCVSLD